MDRHDRSRLRTEPRLDVGRVHVKATGQRVTEHGTPTHVRDYRGASRKRVSRHKDFVLRLKSYYIERKLKGRGARVHGQCISTSDVSLKVALELMRHGPCGQPSGLKHLGDGS